MADASSSNALELELRELGATLAVGPTPDVRVAVRTRLATQPARSHLRSRRRLVAMLTVALTFTGVLIASPAARAAVVRVLSLAGIDLRDEPAPAPHGEGRLPGERPMTLDQARSRVSFPVLSPESLGRLDRVAVSDGGRVVTLVYAPAPGRSSVRIDESGQSLQPFFAKFTDPKLAEEVEVAGYRGLWVRSPHDVAYVDAAGRILPETVRLAAATLVWQRGAVTVRMEGFATRDAALAVAASFGK